MPPARTQSGRGDNYFKDDPQLQHQMGNLDGVSSKADFIKWRSSFLEVVDAFLDQEGSIKAAEAYTQFTTHVRSLQKTKGKLQACLDNGSLSPEKASVKARRALSELQASLANVTARLQQLLPGNKGDNVGYSNYHMGAMLVREGFQSYGTLQDCDESMLAGKEEALQYVADKQLLQEIDYYHEKLQTFVAIMSDLGLMKIALKAQEIAKLDPAGDAGNDTTEEDDLMHQFRVATTSKPPEPEPEPEIIPPSPEPEPVVDVPEPTPEPDLTPSLPVEAERVAEPMASELAPELVQEPQQIVTPDPEPVTTAPESAPEHVSVEEETKEEQRVINITTSHKAPRKEAHAAAPRKIIRRKKKQVDNDPTDDEPDLPRTMKPKAKAQFGNNVGRGAGRKISKEEAKERRPVQPRKKTVPAKNTPDKRNDEDDKDIENEEDDNEDEDDDDGKDENEEKKEQAPKKPNGTKKNGLATSRTRSSTQQSGTAVTANAKQSQSAKKKGESKISINVHHMDGSQIKLMIDLSKDTLGDIKKQLAQILKVPVEQQRISMKYSGQEFSVDSKKISFYGVKEDSDVDIDLQWIQIKVDVTADGRKERHIIKVAPASDTIDKMKTKIAKESGLPPVKQILIFNKQELLEGSKTAKVVGIKDGSTLKVQQCSKVAVIVKTMDNMKITITVNLNKDNLDVIKKQLQKETGVKESNQRVFYGGTELLGEEKAKKKSLVPGILAKKKRTKTIAEYGIKANAELDMEPKKLDITVEMPNGKCHKIKVTPASNMSDLIALMVKKQADLAESSGTQVLKFGGKTFPKGKTVKQMGLRDGSKVKLELA